MSSKPRDLIVLVNLVKDESSINLLDPSVWRRKNESALELLNPPVWRRFKVSAHVNLDLFHDKILAPIMGWTRNYHTYSFKGKGGCYAQIDTTAPDANARGNARW
jgi:hypothetical protein